MRRKGRRIALMTAALAVAVLALASWLSYPHLRFWYLFEPLGVNAQGYREYRHRQTGIVMVRLPGGTFWMGAQKTDPDGHNFDPNCNDSGEAPVHKVALSSFLIGKYEVTCEQWKAQNLFCPFEEYYDDMKLMALGDLPAANLSWNDIRGFEKKTGLKLPTESQWEYACRAGTNTPFGGSNKITEMGWYCENSRGLAQRVGQKAANAFGLHDMHGNLSEWCEDFFARYSSEKATDPVCERGYTGTNISNGSHILRGGFWNDNAWYCRSSVRVPQLPDIGGDVGFRAAYYPLP